MNINQWLRRFYEVLDGTTKEIFKLKKVFEEQPKDNDNQRQKP